MVGNINISLVNWPGTRCYGFFQHEYLGLSVIVQTDKDSDLHVAGDPCLTIWLRHGN